MRAQELNEDTLVIEWFSIINASKNTQRNYLQALQFYTEWTGKTPEELVLKAEEEIKNGILPRLRSVKKYMIGFRKHLQDKGSAQNTVKINMNGVLSFYRSFEIELPVLPKSGEKTSVLVENVEVPTKEDLQTVLKTCDPLERAVVLTGVASGLSSNEIRHLRLRHFKQGYDPETEITIIHIRREKEQVDFMTFLTPECSRAVIEYINFRGRTAKTGKTSRLTPLIKQAVISDNDYLFIKKHVPNSYLKTHDENERHIGRETFLDMYRGISEKAKKNTAKGNWNLIRSHNVRRYFNSALVNAGCENVYVEYWMGHTLNATQAAYFRPDPKQQKELYKRFIPYLMIQKELDYVESPEFQKQQLEIQKYKAQAYQNIVENQEIEALKLALECEKADRVEYERNVEGMIEYIVSVKLKEHRKQEEEGYNAIMEKMAKNLKEKPIDVEKFLED